MSLQRAPERYSKEDQDRLRLDLDGRDKRARKIGQDVEIAGDERLILSASDGSRWSVIVDSSGNLASVPA